MTTARALEVRDFKKSIVKPFAKSEHPAVIKPALWDLLYLDLFVPVVFFYKSTGSSFAEQVAHLKDSLSKVLVPYYTLAGRWVSTQDERIRELLCNDEGVPFFEAQIDEDLETVLGDLDHDFSSIPELGNFSMMGLDDDVFQQKPDFPRPPLYVQVTGFKNGGLSLFVTFNHQGTDGKGFFDFMISWSNQAVHDYLGWIASQMPPAEPKPTDVEPETRSNGHSSGSNGNSATVPTSHASNGDAHGKELPEKDYEAELRFPIQIPMKTAVWSVRKEAIQELKRQAIAANPDEYVTTVDCITSYIWRSLNSLKGDFRDSRTRTRPFNEKGSPEFVLASAVDSRKRCHDPPLPDSYSGNCMFGVLTPRVPPAELARKTHLEAARIIHRTLREINPTTWRRSLLNTIGFMSGWQDSETRNVLVSSWFSFPMYDVELSHGLGKPFYVAVNSNAGFLPEGIVTILPPRPGSDSAATLRLGLPDDMLDALSNEQFLSFFL